MDAMHDISPDRSATTILKTEVIHLIQPEIDLRHDQLDNLTIISVLQLICCNLIQGDERELAIHEQGLQIMVQHQGGLNDSGVNGDLAAMLLVYVLPST